MKKPLFTITRINTKILLFISCLTIGVLTLTTLITSIMFTNTVAKNKIDILEAEMSNLTRQLGEKVEVAHALANKTRNDPHIQMYFEEQNLTQESFDATAQSLWNYLSDSNDYKPYYVNKIIPITNDLQILDPLFSTETYKKSILDNDWFEAFRISHYTSRFSEVYTLPTDVGRYKTIAYISKYLNNNTYEQRGYMMVAFKTSFIFESFDRTNKKLFDSMYIINRDNKIIYAVGDVEKEIESYVSNNLISTGSNVFAAKMNNQNMYIFNHVVGNYSDWVAVGIISKNRLYSDIYRLNLIICIVGLTGIILTILIGNYLSRKISKPIVEVVDAMGLIEKGEWPEAITPKTNDELKLLARGFNRMSENIKTLIEGIYTEQEEKKRAEIMALEFQLEMLRYQINPHFIYNTINALSSMALKSGHEEIRTSLQSFSLLLKRTLSSSEEFFTLYKEIECIRAFLDIQRLRYGDVFEFDCRVEESLKELYIPRFTIQPLVENALFHGIVPSGVGKISVAFKIEKERLRITVSDNGVGLKGQTLETLLSPSKSKYDKFNNIGLNNINERLKLYYGGEYCLMLDEGYSQGTSIYFYIPLDAH